MKIVIDIDEKDYEDILNGETKASSLNWSTFNAIRDGTPLPKGHGRLIDADVDIKGLREMKVVDEKDKQSVRFATIVLVNAPTVIEADDESDSE